MPTATSEELEALLEVQAQDTELDRLRRARAELPERAAADAVRTRLLEVDAELAAARARRDDVLAEEQRFDREVAAIRDRASEVEGTLYGGSVSSPRELQALQADLESLRRHQSNVEDRELDAMERREAADAELATLTSRRDDVAAELGELERAIADAEAELDRAASGVTATRAEIADRVNAALLADYEARRGRGRGIGVARLVGTRCQGCGLTIPAVEADRFHRAPAGTLCEPEDCTCILVPAST